MKKQFFLLAAITCIAFALKAQNFTGHYAIQSREIIEGKDYINAIALELTITQTKDSIKIIRVTPLGNDQTATSIETLPLNGKQIISTTSSKRKKVSSVSFDKEKSTATLTTTYSYEDKPDEIEFKNVELWDLDADGTFTITKTSDAAVTDDWTIKAVFKKS